MSHGSRRLRGEEGREQRRFACAELFRGRSSGGLRVSFFAEAVADESTRGIAELVSRQRRARPRQRAPAGAEAASPSQKAARVPRRGRAPVLPGRVKAERRELPSSSPVLLSDSGKAFSAALPGGSGTGSGRYARSEVLSSPSTAVRSSRREQVPCTPRRSTWQVRWSRRSWHKMKLCLI